MPSLGVFFFGVILLVICQQQQLASAQAVTLANSSVVDITGFIATFRGISVLDNDGSRHDWGGSPCVKSTCELGHSFIGTNTSSLVGGVCGDVKFNERTGLVVDGDHATAVFTGVHASAPWAMWTLRLGLICGENELPIVDGRYSVVKAAGTSAVAHLNIRSSAFCAMAPICPNVNFTRCRECALCSNNFFVWSTAKSPVWSQQLGRCYYAQQGKRLPIEAFPSKALGCEANLACPQLTPTTSTCVFAVEKCTATWCPSNSRAHASLTECAKQCSVPCVTDSLGCCTRLAPVECEAWKDTCELYAPMLDLPSGRAYCYSRNSTCVPVTCASIGSDRRRCDAAGCDFNNATGRCIPVHGCLVFFLYGYLPMPLPLTALGIVKDLLVLLLVGILGDWFMCRFTYYRKQFTKKDDNLPNCILDTSMHVFIADSQCHRLTLFSFDAYSERVARALFSFVSSGPASDQHLDDAGESSLLKHKKKHNDNVDEQRRRMLQDAVACALCSEKLWVNLPSLPFDEDKALEEEQQQQQQQQQTPSAASESQPPQGDHPQLPASSVSCNRAEDDDKPGIPVAGRSNNSFAHLLRPDTASNQATAITATSLSVEDFDSRAALYHAVVPVLTQHATAYVFYANSSHPMRNVALGVVRFPSTPQIFFYTSMLTLMICLTFFDVLAERVRIEKILGSCETEQLSNEANSVFSVSVFMIIFRCVNSSSLATSLLVAVKTIRALFKLRSGLDSLPMVERVPIVSLASSRWLQLALFIYIGIFLLPFAVFPVTYGWTKGWECGISFVAAAALLFVVHILGKCCLEDPDEEDDDDDAQSMATAQGGGYGTNKSVATVESDSDKFTLCDLLHQLVAFLLREEIQTVVLTVAIQLGVNITILLTFASEFGIDRSTDVFSVDFESRSIKCLLDAVVQKAEASLHLSVASSVVPFT